MLIRSRSIALALVLLVAMFHMACDATQPGERTLDGGVLLTWELGADDISVYADCDSIYIDSDGCEIKTNLPWQDLCIGHRWSAYLYLERYPSQPDSLLAIWTTVSGSAIGAIEQLADSTLAIDGAVAHDYGDAPLDVYLVFEVCLAGEPYSGQSGTHLNFSFPTDCSTGGGGSGGHGGKEPPPQQGISRWADEILSTPMPENITDAQRLLEQIDAWTLATSDDVSRSQHCCFGTRWMWENANNDSTRAAIRGMRRQLSSKFIFLRTEDGTSVITGLR